MLHYMDDDAKALRADCVTLLDELSAGLVSVSVVATVAAEPVFGRRVKRIVLEAYELLHELRLNFEAHDYVVKARPLT